MPDRDGLKTSRVFLALWPDDSVRNRLAAQGRRLHKSLTGKLTRPETIHLTLAFIGPLAVDRQKSLCEALLSVSVPRFEVVFDRAECWSHNRIGFVAPTEIPSNLFDLVGGLEKTLDKLGITYDRRPYKPHITLIRKANCPKKNPAGGRVPVSPEWGDFAPIKWSADNFVLVESVLSAEGSNYRLVERFALS